MTSPATSSAENENTGKQAPATAKPVPERSCGDCTMCCKLIKVDALQKPQGTWCQHCNPGKGCRIYEKRPQECVDFFCGYMTSPQVGEEWKPVHSKIVLLTDVGGKRITAFVDPQRPDAWRAEPYYSTLKKWARLTGAYQKQVRVAVGKRLHIILPDKDTDLGIVADDEIVLTGTKNTPAGPEVTAFKARRDDPRVQKLLSQQQASAQEEL